MERLANVGTRALADTTIEKDKVLWAAVTERFVPKWPAGEGPRAFGTVMERLRSDMPDRVPI